MNSSVALAGTLAQLASRATAMTLMAAGSITAILTLEALTSQEARRPT
ncbi:hypothetical protein [Streptomyces niveus]